MIDLEVRLNNVKRIFNIEKILNRDVKNPEEIARYYRLNRPIYWLFLSRDGFVHLASKRHETSGINYFAPADFVSKYIKTNDAHMILELGAGKGGNLKYLAKRHSKIKFVGLDLPDGQFKIKHFKNHKNIEALYGDYHDLKYFDDSSIDLIYIIEALVHARNQLKVFKEVSRVLKPRGLLILAQDNLTIPFSRLWPSEKLAFKLLHAGVMSAHDSRQYSDLKKSLESVGMELADGEDITADVMSGLMRMDRQASWFIHHPHFLRIIDKILPNEITANVITPYLLRPMFERCILKYHLTVARKP